VKTEVKSPSSFVRGKLSALFAYLAIRVSLHAVLFMKCDPPSLATHSPEYSWNEFDSYLL
jgi:hypothetical protein